MRKIEVGEVAYIDDLCLTEGTFAQELCVVPATQAKLVHTSERTAASVQYLQVVNGTHTGEVIEVTTSFRGGRPTLATARCLNSPVALIWLKNTIWDKYQTNIRFPMVATA